MLPYTLSDRGQMTISKKRKLLFFDVLRYVPEMKKIIKNVKAYYDNNLSSNKAAFSVK
jgi:hypothetical protein